MDSRESFEKWHSHIFEQHIPSIRQEYGYPADSIVQTRWQAWSFAWQAAWSACTQPTVSQSKLVE